MAQVAVKVALPLSLLLVAIAASLLWHHSITVSVPDWAGAAVLAFIVSDVSIRQSIDTRLGTSPDAGGSRTWRPDFTPC